MATGRGSGINTADFSDDESALSDQFIESCSFKTPGLVLRPINSCELSQKSLSTYLNSGVVCEKENIADGQHWFDYYPDGILINNTKVKQKYIDFMNHNIPIVANFCVEDPTDKRFKTAMNDCFQRARFQNLLGYYPIEFGHDRINVSFNNALQVMKSAMTADLGQDIQRNVCFLFQSVMLQLVQTKLINGHYFSNWCRQHRTPASDLLNDAVNHTTCLIRYFLKLFCIDKAEDAFLSKDDRHEVWKSILTELARYAGVMYSLNGETKRYFISKGNQRSVTVKADLEIMMNACSPFFEVASIPRIIVEVYGKKGDYSSDPHKEMGQGDSVQQTALSVIEAHESSPSIGFQDDNSDSASLKDSGFNHGDTKYSSEPVRPKIATKRTGFRNTSRYPSSDSSSASSGSRRGHLHSALPDCIKENKEMGDLAWVKKKLFGQHAAQLTTIQQSLEYCNPCLPDQNKTHPVIGLFVQNEKVLFTKLTGSRETGRKLAVSNWCLRMNRFADRLLLMVFLRAYCEEDVNLNVSVPLDS